MIASFLIRFLLVLGLTLAPIVLASLWFRQELCGGDPRQIAAHTGTHYAVLTVVGSIALALMLSAVA
jgi:hypothetical protein